MTTDEMISGTLPAYIYGEVDDESSRAHAKHGETSMLGEDCTDRDRMAILSEEIGEVARVLNDDRHQRQAIGKATIDEWERIDEKFCADLRAELVQVAAMAAGWIWVLDGRP